MRKSFFNNMQIKRRRVTKAVLEKRLKVLKTLLAKNSDEFCKNTTLHGLQYLRSKDLQLFEKLFFALCIIFVFFLSLFFIVQVYDKWKLTPVIFSINPEPTYVVDQPFPAVTICNLNVAYKSKVEHFSVYSVEYAMLQMLCKREVNVTIADTIKDWNILNNFITEISQPCSNMLLACHFGAVQYNCSDIFTSEVTEEGLCCVFNMVHPAYRFRTVAPLKENYTNDAGYMPVNWSTEKGYMGKLPPKFYPRKAAGTGETLGLTLTLDAEADNYYCSSSHSIGFKILLHNPTESANIREVGMLLPPGRETKMRIQADKIETEQQLRSIDKHVRNCLFEDELVLDVFSHYTERNCEIECMAFNLINNCSCVAHYIPKLYGNESTCSIYDVSCMERVRLNSMFSGYGRACHEICMPSCYDLTFLPDVFSTPLSHFGFQIVNQVVNNMSSEYVERNVAIINMYFKENSYHSAKQTEFIGSIDVLSSIGGLMGVFLGFSFISLAEFIFYGLMRPFRAVRQVAPHGDTFVKPTSKKLYMQPMKGFGNSFSRSRTITNNAHIDSKYMEREFLKSISEIIDQENNSKGSWNFENI